MGNTKPQLKESDILHETANIYLNSNLEIILNGPTAGLVIGKATSIEQAKRVMGRLERYPAQLRNLYWQ